MINPITLREIEDSAASFASTKERVVAKIKKNVAMAMEKLRTVEKELLDQVEDEFGVNPFEGLLNDIRSGINYPEDSIRSLLNNSFPTEFGPSERSFRSICKEIESLKSWEGPSEKRPCLDLVPKNIRYSNVTSSRFSILWDGVEEDCIYEVEIKSPIGPEITYSSCKPEYTFSGLEPNTEYKVRVRTIGESASQCIWSGPIIVKTSHGFPLSGWKKCPEKVRPGKRYRVSLNNPRIATKMGRDFECCTIIGAAPIPLNRVTSWDIKILETKTSSGGGIFIGVAPYGINQNIGSNYEKCGWYFYCYESELWSGPPHNYSGKKFGPRRWFSKYVTNGSFVGVTMDTMRGILSFELNGKDLGDAYIGIPLDRPLVSSVILEMEGDSIEVLPLDAQSLPSPSPSSFSSSSSSSSSTLGNASDPICLD